MKLPEMRRVVAMTGTDAGTAVWQLACGHVYHWRARDMEVAEKHRRDIEAFEQGHQFVRRCVGCEQGVAPRYQPGEVDLLAVAAGELRFEEGEEG